MFVSMLIHTYFCFCYPNIWSCN